MTSHRERLITFTEHKIMEAERPADVGLNLGIQFDRPKCPMLVLNMSSTLSDDHIYQLKNDLFSIWPRYSEIIPFISELNGIDYRSTVEGLMDYNNNFAKYNFVLLYFIVDTSDFSNAEDFTRKLEEIKRVKEQIANFATPKCVLFLLFSANGPASDEIRSEMRGLYHGEHSGLDLVVIVSNLLSVGAYVKEYRERIRELTPIILLTNGGGSGGANPLQLNEFRVVTIKAKHWEKPYSDIAKVIITQIFLSIQNRLRLVTTNSRFDETDVMRKIGVDSISHRFELFEKEVKDSSIIEEEELDFFPISDPYTSIDPSLMSYEDFDAMTFGTLEAFLQERIRSSEFYDPQKREQLAREYRDYLYTNLYLWDLNAMMGRVPLLKARYEEGINNASSEKGILEVFKAKYKTNISIDKGFYSLFFDEIEKACKEANGYGSFLNSLINSIVAIQFVTDEKMCSHYRQLTETYISNNPNEIEDLLKVDVLQESDYENAFIEKIEELISNIISENSQLFSLPFVLSLIHIWGVTSINDLADEITNSENTKLYFRPIIGTTGDLSSIFGNNSVLLINKNGELASAINTDQFHYVMDTMSDSFIDKMDLLEIKEGNI